MSKLDEPRGAEDLIYRANYRLEIGLYRVTEWLDDARRQMHHLSASDAVRRVRSRWADANPEAVSFKTGERLTTFDLSGERRRFKVVGSLSSGRRICYSALDLVEGRLCSLWDLTSAGGGLEAQPEGSVNVAAISLLLGDHPNIITSYSAFYHSGRLLLHTESIAENTPLRSRLSSGALDLRDVLGFAIQICRAMAHFQRSFPGFTHGSLTSGNVFTYPGGVVKLGGFFSSEADDIPPAAKGMLTGSRGEAGRPKSQISGWRQKSPDSAAFGELLVEMVTGTVPEDWACRRERDKWKELPKTVLESLAEKGSPTELVRFIRDCFCERPGGFGGDFAEIEKRLSSINSKTPDSRSPQRYLKATTPEATARRARSLAAIGLPLVAAREMDAAIELFGESPEALASRALVSLCGSQLEEASDFSIRALREHSDSFQVLLARGQVLIYLGKSRAAEQLLRRALEIKPYNCFVLNLLGDIYRSSGLHREAWICYDQSVNADSSQVAPLEGLARIFLAMGNRKAAIRRARQAIRLKPDGVESFRVLAESYVLQGRFRDSVDAYKSAIGNGLACKGARKEFARACIRLFAADNKLMSLKQAGLILLGTRLLVEAEAANKGLEGFVIRLRDLLRPEKFDPLFISFFDPILEKLVPRMTGTQVKDLGDSVDAAWRSVRHRTQSLEGLDSIGKACFTLGRLEICEEIFLISVKMGARDDLAYRYLGKCAEARGALDESLSHYRMARKIRDTAEARSGVRRVHSKLKDSKIEAGRLQAYSN